MTTSRGVAVETMAFVPTPNEFDALYRRDRDPWEVATSWYERRKIALVLAALRRRTYASIWDAGCGTGELSVALTERSSRVVATDASAAACALTRERVRGAPGVSVEHSALPARPAALTDPVDLVVVSEVLYYLDEDDLAATCQTVSQVCHDRSDVVAVHWRPRPEGARTTGAAAQRALNSHLIGRGYERLVTLTDVEFVLGLWSRDVPTSIGR